MRRLGIKLMGERAAMPNNEAYNYPYFRVRFGWALTEGYGPINAVRHAWRFRPTDKRVARKARGL